MIPFHNMQYSYFGKLVCRGSTLQKNRSPSSVCSHRIHLCNWHYYFTHSIIRQFTLDLTKVGKKGLRRFHNRDTVLLSTAVTQMTFSQAVAAVDLISTSSYHLLRGDWRLLFSAQKTTFQPSCSINAEHALNCPCTPGIYLQQNKC